MQIQIRNAGTWIQIQITGTQIRIKNTGMQIQTWSLWQETLLAAVCTVPAVILVIEVTKILLWTNTKYKGTEMQMQR